MIGFPTVIVVPLLDITGNVIAPPSEMYAPEPFCMPSFTISVTAGTDKVMVDVADPAGAGLLRYHEGFVRGTTSEMVSAPVSLTAFIGTAGLLSTGLIATVTPPAAQLPATPPTGVAKGSGMPNPACLMSLAINSMAILVFCCVPTARSFEIVALFVVVSMVYPAATMTDEITIEIINSMSVNPRSSSICPSLT
jgi:hypothetical protein